MKAFLVCRTNNFKNAIFSAEYCECKAICGTYAMKKYHCETEKICLVSKGSRTKKEKSMHAFDVNTIILPIFEIDLPETRTLKCNIANCQFIR